VATNTTNGDPARDEGRGGDAEQRGMLSSSLGMAVGTMASRITGFGKVIMLAAAVGTQLLGDAYNTANTIPFVINDLLIGGLMASVIVPFLVRRRKRDSDGGRATEDRLFTSAVLLLFVVTAVAILGAELLIRLYGGGFTGPQFDVAVYLARFLLAQIFFVGLSGLVTAMLHTRGSFAIGAWAPVANNVVIIAVAAAFLVLAPSQPTPETVAGQDGLLTLLGLGTACAMALQALILLGALWRAGFRWRPRLDLRGSGLGEALRNAGWMFVYICMTQIGFLITANVVNRAGVLSVEDGQGVGAGLTAYNYAFQLFQLPYAIIAVSLITVLLPTMSAHAADERWDEVRSGFSRTLRVSAFILVPLSLAIAVFAIPLARLAFARGSTGADDAANIGLVLIAMSLGLLPFTIFQLMLRVFYALGDTRTPAFLGAANVAVHGGLAVLAFLILPPEHVVVGVAGGFMASFLSGLLIAGAVLGRRLGGLDGLRICGTLLRLYLAAAPSVAVGIATLLLFEERFSPGPVVDIGAPAVGCLAGALLFLLGAKLLRIRELGAMSDLVRSKLRRGR
jgi:putative peptidoglycan lipid II flippase